jgi:DNA-binding transcriptional LysR family regulator/two-component sensor histidine kinase
MRTADEGLKSFDPRQLRYLITLAHLTSVRRASARLSIPPRMLLREVVSVEHTLGVRLFDRTRDRMVPTEAGTEVARFAECALATHRVEGREVTQDGARLRVGWLDYGQGQAVQRAAMNEFRAQHPQILVHLVPSIFGDQPGSIADGSLDVGFCQGSKPLASGVEVALYTSESVSCALMPAEYPMAAQEVVSLAELSGFPCHSLRTDHAPELMAGVHESIAHGGWRGRHTHGSPSPSEVITAVGCGAGWAPVPSQMLGWAPPGMRVTVLAEGSLMSINLYAMWSEENALARRFTQLLFQLRDLFAGATAREEKARWDNHVTAGSLFAQRHAERARVARELDEVLCANLNNGKVELEALRQRLPMALEREGRVLKEVSERLDHVVRVGLEVLRNQQPARTQPRELTAELTAVAEAVSTCSAAEFCVHGTGVQRGLRADVEEAVTAVGAEAVRNAFRHARASRITVTLEYRDASFRLTVADDGTGVAAEILETGARPGHLGFPLMRERAARVGGTLAIGRGPAGGTVVRVVVPGHLAYSVERRDGGPRVHTG